MERNTRGHSAADRYRIRGVLHLFMATLEAQATSGQKKAQQPEWAGFHPWIR